MAKTKPAYYAVRYGRTPGIYTTWTETEAQTKGFTGAVHKGFMTRTEAENFVAGRATAPVANRAPHTFNHASGSGSGSAATAGRKTRAREDDDGGANEPEVKRVKKVVSKGAADKVYEKNGKDRTVFTDGSSLGNGKANSAAGLGVFWSVKPGSPNISERLPGPLQTNNRAEMFAVARVLETDPNPELPLTICTDSTYTIDVFSKWIPGWRSKGWRTAAGKPVMNRDMIEYILALIALRMPANSTSAKSPTANVSFVKVKAHCGIVGNEQADQLAKNGAALPVVKDRDYAKDTKALEKKLRDKGIVKKDQIVFEVLDLPEDLLMTEEEERELERENKN